MHTNDETATRALRAGRALYELEWFADNIAPYRGAFTEVQRARVDAVVKVLREIAAEIREDLGNG